MEQKISGKILFVSVACLVVIITIISLAYTCQSHFKNIVVSQTLGQLLTTAKTASHGLEEFVSEHSASLKALSKSQYIQKMAYNREISHPGQEGSCYTESCPLKTLYDIQKSRESELDHLSISLLDAGGGMLCRQPYIKDRIGMDYTDRPGVAYVLREHRPWVSDVFYNAPGNLAISVLQPLFYRDKFAGMLRWMTELNTISKGFVQSIKIGRTGYVWMINDRGIILSHPQKEFIGKPVTDLIRKGASDKGLSVDETGIKGLIQKRYGYLERLKTEKEGYGIYEDCLTGRDELVAFKAVSLGKTDWHLIIALPYSEIAGPINDHGYNMLGLAGGFILLLGLGGLALHRNRKRQVQLETETKYLREIDQSANALRESEARYRSLFEDSGDAIYINTKEGKFIDVNQSALDLLGYTREEMIGMDVRNIYVNPDDRSVFQQEMEQKGSVRDYEVKFRKKDGTQMDCLLTSSTWQGNGGRILGYQGIIRDITKQKQLEARVRQTQKMEAIGTLAGGIAHDFNNILMSITGNTEMALYDAPESSPVRSRLEGVLKAGSRAKYLVQQILTFSRQREEKRTPIQISSVVKEALKLLRASLPTTIEIHRDISAGADTVLADPTKIHQVLMNLCTNAAQAMHEKGGLLEVGVTDADLDSEAVARYPDLSPGPYVVLTVSDTGQGMDRSVMERIFDPFFSTKGPGEGTGLGLAVVHGIVKDYGGAIDVCSEPGKGTTFRVFLPRVDEVAMAEAEMSASIPTGCERILLIDDEKAVVEPAQCLLEHLGYEIVSKTSAVEALEMFRADPDRFDIVITDHTMPHMTGQDLAGEFLRMRPDIPIILCTGFAEPSISETAKASGIRELIAKPVAIHELAETIRNVLDG